MRWCGRDLLRGVADPDSAYGRMQPGVGIRGWVYFACAGTLFGWGLFGTLGVVSGLLPADPTDDYAAISAFIALWMPVAAFINNRGEKRSFEQKAEEFVYVWLLTSGLAQCLWEIPFVLMKTSLLQPIASTETLTGSEKWLWAWWM